MDLGRLQSLRELTLNCKTLTSLPELGGMVGLTILDLTGCRSLRALCDSICELTNLRDLVLDDCVSLSTLPDWIGNLSSSLSKTSRNRTVDLTTCTGLTELPASFDKIPWTQERLIPRPNLPPGVVGPIPRRSDKRVVTKKEADTVRPTPRIAAATEDAGATGKHVGTDAIRIMRGPFYASGVDGCLAE